MLQVTKTEMKQTISRFETIVEQLRNSVPTSLFNQIIYTDNHSKIADLKKFVSS